MSFHHIVRALLALAVVACAGTPPPEPKAATHRMTRLGAVIGIEADHDSHAWYGIPYAAPPIGALRWRAPAPAAAWTGIRHTVAPGPICPQAANAQLDTDADFVGSEDCLTLNVHAPRFSPADVPVGADRLPVMVWLHGGGNTIGAGSLYDGGRLAAEQSVVVVTINSRIGPLGYLRHAALRAESATPEEASGSFGLLDIVAALEWVQANAEVFGGDPSNVTLFGESAGARNTLAMLRSPIAEGLFHRAIVQSGGPRYMTLALAENFVDAPREPGHRNSSNELILRLLQRERGAADREAALDQWRALGEAELTAWLRTLTPESLLRAYVPGPSERLGMLDVPQEFPDGVVLPALDAWAQFASGDYHRVPVILGTNRDEMKLFMVQDRTHVIDPLGASLSVRARDPEKYEMISGYFSKAWKAEGVDEIAQRMLAAQGPSVFAYRFDWDEQPTLLFSNFSRMLGAAHLFEVPFVFGVWDLGSRANAMFTGGNLAGREELSAAMRSYWAHFARTGDPARGAADNLPEWRPWSHDADTSALLVLDTSSDGGIRMSADRVSAVGVVAEIAEDERMPLQEDKCVLVEGLWPSRPLVAQIAADRMSCDPPPGVVPASQAR
jgi:para-nitrobenzyl esterase